MHWKNSDIVMALVMVLLNVVWLLLHFTVLWVSILLSLPLVFFVPGFMLTAILTHTRGLDVFQRLTLSLGLSLTLDILGGFLLNVLPIGLRTQSWIVLLSCLTLLFALVALYLRRGMVYVSEREDRKMPVGTASSRPGGGAVGHTSGQGTVAHALPLPTPQDAMKRFLPRARDGILFALAATLVILALVYATQGVAEGQNVGFTQLWMLPPSHSAQNCTVNVGIHSFENSPVTYHAVLTVNGIQTMSWPTLVLTPNQLWQRTVTVTPTTFKSTFVEMKLYRNDHPTMVYREVHMTLNILNNTQKGLHCGT
jgi:uncharacterized membrane protein